MKKLSRLLKTSRSYMKRNRGLAFSTVVVVFITFFITTLFSLLFIGSQYLFQALEQQIGFDMFFYADTDESDILELKAQLESKHPQLRIEYWSKDDIFAEYVQLFGDDAGEFTDDEDLTPALRMNSVDISDVEAAYNEVMANTEVMETVHSYTYFEQAVGVVKKATMGVFWGGVG